MSQLEYTLERGWEKRVDQSDFQRMQREAARAPSAKFANRAFAQVVGQFLRVAFGEELAPADPRYHTAVLLTLDDARELAFLIYDLVETEKERQELEKETPDLFEKIMLPTATDDEVRDGR